MTAAGIGGGSVEAGLVGLAGGDGVLHGVIDVEDGVFGAVVAVGSFIFVFYNGNEVHDFLSFRNRHRDCLCLVFFTDYFFFDFSDILSHRHYCSQGSDWCSKKTDGMRNSNRCQH